MYNEVDKGEPAGSRVYSHRVYIVCTLCVCISMHACVSLSLSIYIYIYICTHIHMYIYIYIEREKEREITKVFLHTSLRAFTYAHTYHEVDEGEP